MLSPWIVDMIEMKFTQLPSNIAGQHASSYWEESVRKTLFFIVSCIFIRWSTAWPYHSSINNESERFIDRPAIAVHQSAPAVNLLEFEICHQQLFFAKPDLKDCSLQSICWNLKFVTNNFFFAKPDFKDCFLQSICWNLKFVTNKSFLQNLTSRIVPCSHFF